MRSRLDLVTGITAKCKVFVVVLMILAHPVFSQTQPIDSGTIKQTFVYAVKDTNELALDVYRKDSLQTKPGKPCVLFVFGGAFLRGHRNDTIYNRYFNALVEHDFVVIPITYRLGLRGVKNLSKFNIAPLKNAINMAVEDLYDATNWTISHASQLGIDTSRIILSGSSAGAITVLQSEFEKSNSHPIAEKLPAGFKYAGIVAFSGAVLSYSGKPGYKIPPPPTMMFHGTKDQIVPYTRIKFFNKGFWGSSCLADIYKRKNYSYYIYRAVGLGHEESVYPMYTNLPIILDFLDQFVIRQKPFEIDYSFKDPSAKAKLVISGTELLKKLQH